MKSNPSFPPRVAIVGRPNVGKSSIFNALVGRRRAIVEKTAGTTRDRVTETVELEGRTFELVDTGGIDFKDTDTLRRAVMAQAELAIETAERILFVVDAQAGIHPLDEEIASRLRRVAGRVILVSNKADHEGLETAAAEFYRFGFGEPVIVSAAHSRGLGSLRERLESVLPLQTTARVEPAVKVAIVGRPNVGKSSLLNRFLKEERAIVHETPGTTRDALDTLCEIDGRTILLVDTAGIRHKRKIKVVADFFSLTRTREAIERCDVCLFLLEGPEGIVRDDLALLTLLEEFSKPFVLVVNKWDLVEKVKERAYQRSIEGRLSFLRGMPIVFASCKTGKNVEALLPKAFDLAERASKTFPSEKISAVFKKAVEVRRPPIVRGRPIGFRSISQIGTKPPHFKIVLNVETALAPNYRRHLEHSLVKALGLSGVPIRLSFSVKKRRPR